MQIGLRFDGHEQFHRSAGAMTAAGACAGVAVTMAATPDPLVRALVIGAAVAAAAVWGRGERRFDLVASLFAVAAGALALSFSTEPVAGALAFAACAGAAVAGFDRLGAGKRTWAALVAGACAVFVAVGVLERVATADQLAALPPVVSTGLAGAAFGLIAVAGRLPHHLAWRPDRVAAAYAAMGSVDDEVGQLAGRARTMWQSVAETLPEGDENRAAFEGAALRVLEVASGWHAIERSAAASRAGELADRERDLTERVAATDDAVVRDQYQSALDAVREQTRYLRDIGVQRERVVARLHNYLATMEQLRLAVANVRSTEAAQPAGDLAAVLSELEEMGRAMDVDRPAAAIDTE